jgi:hypothetical protein
MDNDIKLNKTAFYKLIDETRDEGKRQGLMLAIDALRNYEFRKTFHLDGVEAEICAEALFTHIDEILR